MSDKTKSASIALRLTDAERADLERRVQLATETTGYLINVSDQVRRDIRQASEHSEIEKSAADRIRWFERIVPRSNAYKVHETYVVYTEGTRLSVQVLDQGVDGDARFIVHVTDDNTGMREQGDQPAATPGRALEEFPWQALLRRLASDG